MNIIQLLDSREVGGIETHVHILSQALKSNNQSVTVVFFKNYGDHALETKLKESKINYYKLDGSLRSLVNFLFRQRPDILHTHGYKAGIVGKLTGIFFKFKVVSTYHSGDPGQGNVRIYTLLDNVLSIFCTPLAVSDEIAQGIGKKARVIKNFVDTSVSPYNKKDSSSIGFVGRLSEEKGPDLFVEISKMFPSIKFHIFGEGIMRQNLQKEALTNCTFHGHIYDVTKAWKEIDMLCMPSRHEGLPMAALEAMARGIPVLASDVGALPDLIDTYENGFISKKGDLGDFKEKIMLWIKCGPEKRSKMSKKAHNTIKYNFSADREIENIINIYKGVCDV